MKKIAVLITTDNTKKGVFAGLIDPQDMDKDSIIVENMRMCIYWSSDMHGVLGLASMGPSSSCRISKAVKKARVHGITAVIELSKEAIPKWEKEPWG